MKRFQLLSAAVLLALLLLLVPGAQAASMLAVARVFGTARHGTVEGLVRFEQQQMGGPVNISWQLSGIPGPDGLRAIHITEWGDTTHERGISTGGHFNPHKKRHGCWPSPERQAGDLGNVEVFEGNSTGSMTRDLFNLAEEHSVVGRSIAIYEMADDCADPEGEAGQRIGVGVIGIQVPPAGQENLARQPLNTTVLVAHFRATAHAEQRMVRGEAFFRWSEGSTQVHLEMRGLEPSTEEEPIYHGLHVHQFGDLSSLSQPATGSHWNPLDKQHALPSEQPVNRHSGDLGNLVVTSPIGMVVFETESALLALSGPENLVGRALVVHSGQDKGLSHQPTGDSGLIIAFGVIGLTNADWPGPGPTLPPHVPPGEEKRAWYEKPGFELLLVGMFMMLGVAVLGYIQHLRKLRREDPQLFGYHGGNSLQIEAGLGGDARGRERGLSL